MRFSGSDTTRGLGGGGWGEPCTDAVVGPDLALATVLETRAVTVVESFPPVPVVFPCLFAPGLAAALIATAVALKRTAAFVIPCFVSCWEGTMVTDLGTADSFGTWLEGGKESIGKLQYSVVSS